jgi:predicted alpha/beta-fold hydrolase
MDTERFPVEVKFYDTEPGVRVLVHSQRPSRPPVAEVIVVHGLEGSSQAGYAQSLAHELLQVGWAAHRFNMRSCGGTEHLSGGSLYHSGQTSDLLAVLRQIKAEAPVFLAGFSLGGNVVLKLAGELGERAHELIAGVIAISTPIDLAACARKLESPSNFVYSRRFLRRLKQRIRLKAQSAPGLFALEHLDAIQTDYEFDDKFTAPLFGFGTADNYYATQSSNQFLDRIQVPSLLVHAKDDPLVPFEVYNHAAFTRNPNLRLLAVEHGGHVGFLSKTPPRFWLDRVLLEWMNEVRNKAAANFVS